MTETQCSPLGVLGGTFDPVHCAHLLLAEEARTKLGLGQVLWVPAGNPPHRRPPIASALQRLAMVSLAIRNQPGFLLDDSEVHATAPSYSVITLQRLRKQYGTRPLVLLLGADAFLGLAGWHRWQDLFALAHLAVATRPGYELNPDNMLSTLRVEFLRRCCSDPNRLAQVPAGLLFPFAITPLAVSASAIRARLGNGLTETLTAQDLPPPAVLDYIANNHLYAAH